MSASTLVRTALRAAVAALALGAAQASAQAPAADPPACVPAAPTGAVRSLRGPQTAAPAPIESAFLAERVKSGQLPAVDKRLPAAPYVVTEFAGPDGPGTPGGEINLLMATARDVRMMVVYGNARLVAFDHKFDLAADILESVEVADGRVFTLRLRKGHRWSDGAPFTSEDFRYFWEDVANNRELSPVGPPIEMIVDGKPPTLEILDETTVRYTWTGPNPGFLQAMARPSPLFVFRPAHYLRQFHKRYADAAQLDARIKELRQRNWASLHNRMDDMYRNENPDLPTLQPWALVTRPPSQRLVFERNPFYHRIDAKGVQLPYLDRVVMNIASASVLPLKAGSGESDLQARYLRFDNYTFLRRGAKQFGFDVRLWDTATGNHLAIYPNLTVKDPVYRALFREPNFRRALSMAIDREEINEIMYIGLAAPSQNTVRPQSPLFREEYASKWTKFDVKEANRLLDKIELRLADGRKGDLRRRDAQGVRLMPDGRPLHILLESAGEGNEEADLLQLVADGWKKIGVKLHVRARDRQDLRTRLYAGETQMTIWTGFENGLARSDSSPSEFACLSQTTLWCSAWGQHRETRGKSGEAIDLATVRRMNDLAARWECVDDRAEQERIWHELLKLHADFVYTIGVVSSVPQPVVVNARLRNLPLKGIHNWDPGAFFGVYRPETLWLGAGK